MVRPAATSATPRPIRATWSRSTVQRADHARVQLAVLGPARADRSAASCPASDSAIWGARRAGDRAGHRPDPVRHRERAVQRLDRLGRQRARAQPGREPLLHNWTPANQAQLNSERPRSREHGAGGAARSSTAVGSRSRAARPAMLDLLDLDRLDGTTGGPGPRLGGEIQDLGARRRRGVHRAGGLESRRPDVRVRCRRVGHGAYVLGGSGASPRLSVAWRSGTPGPAR